MFPSPALFLAALLVRAATEPATTGDTCDAQGGACASEGKQAHFWPRARGHLGSYGVTNLTGPWDLSKPALIWHPGDSRFQDVMLCGPLIDRDYGLYVTSARGVHKLTTDGQLLWTAQPDPLLTSCPSLTEDGRLFGSSADGLVYALSAETGTVLWQYRAASMNGDTAYLEYHDGLVLSQAICSQGPVCTGSDKLLALSAKDGTLVWDFTPDNPLWNFMAMFPEDGSVVFQDFHSVTYRVNLSDGSLIWKAGGHHSPVQTWTDGGAMLGSNGVVYSVSSMAAIINHTSTSGGGVHAYRLTDGKLLWERQLKRPFFTWPALGNLVGKSDPSVIVAVGSNSYFPWNMVLYLVGSSLASLGALLGIFCSLCGCCCCGQGCGIGKLIKRVIVWGFFGTLLAGLLTFLYLQGFVIFPVGYFQADVIAFDAATGLQQWVFRVPDYNKTYAAGDLEGYLERQRHVAKRPVCLPAAFNSPTIDSAGNVYIGYMSGEMFVLKDANGDGVVEGPDEVSVYNTQGAFLHSGAAFAPGIMGVTNCDSLYLWRM